MFNLGNIIEFSIESILNKVRNGNSNNRNLNAWKDNGAKVDQEKAGGKTKEHANKGYDKNLMLMKKVMPTVRTRINPKMGNM